MNLYIKNKMQRKAAAWMLGLFVWLIFMYLIAEFAVWSCEHLGMAGCVPPLIVALLFYNWIENKNKVIRDRKIVKKRRIQFNDVRRRTYEQAGILDQYEDMPTHYLREH